MKRLILGSVASAALIYGGAATAADAPVYKAPMAEKAEPIQYIDAFAGFDATSQRSYFGFAGATFAPWGGLETSGLRIGLFGGAGSYRYDSDSTAIKGTFVTGDFLVGYGYTVDNFDAKLLVGVNVQDHVLSAPDPENPVQGTKVGAKVQGDFWLNPTEQTLVYGLASYSTAFRTYYATAKLGYDISGGHELFIGPQFTALGNDRFDQWRIGAHITSFKLGPIDVGFGGGYLHDSGDGPGAYGSVDLGFRF